MSVRHAPNHVKLLQILLLKKDGLLRFQPRVILLGSVDRLCSVIDENVKVGNVGFEVIQKFVDGPEVLEVQVANPQPVLELGEVGLLGVPLDGIGREPCRRYHEAAVPQQPQGGLEANLDPGPCHDGVHLVEVGLGLLHGLVQLVALTTDGRFGIYYCG